MAQNKPYFTKVVVPQMKNVGKMLVVALATHSSRIVLLVFAIVVAGLLLYTGAWQTLKEDAGLPVGVTPRNPELDAATLQSINDARVERSRHKITSYASFDQYFAQQTPSPTPATVPLSP